MVKDRKLKTTLDRFKGVDHKLEHQKKLQKQAEKRKRSKNAQSGDAGASDGLTAGAEEDSEAQRLARDPEERQHEESAANGAELAEKTNGQADGWETDESEEADEKETEDGGIALGTFEDESDSDSEGEDTFYTAAGGSPVKKLPNGGKSTEDDEDDEDDEEEDEDIPLSDIESLASEDRGDVIPHQRLTINNTSALQRSLKAFALPAGLPFSTTQSVTSLEPVVIADVEDDLGRELAFYKQSLDAVKEARIQLKKEGVAFTRPTDYFAEMVKSEEQMGKVRLKMVDAAARKKASSDARRQRDLKKFGKAVQTAKLQERAKDKRDTLEKINVLKRKRQGADLNANEDDMFDVALENAADTEKADRAERRSKGARGGAPNKRQKKDEKFGFGGKKRFAKSNDAKSSADVSGFSAKRMKGGKGGKPRPGKSKRART